MPLEPDLARMLAGWQHAARYLGPALLNQPDVPWAKAREVYSQELADLLPPPEGVSFESIILGGVPTMLVTPDNADRSRALLYIHGGGYVHGAVEPYRVLTGEYAKRLGIPVYVPDYRQAPEYPFPTPIQDVFTVYEELVSGGLHTGSLAVSGDSAGGAMAITVMRWARDRGLDLPVAAVAISPWADLTNTGASMRTRDGLDPLVNERTLNQLAATFLQGALPTDPDASPVFADVRALPATLIQIGENEVMLDNALDLGRNLAHQRVRMTLEVWPEMFHVWHMFAGHSALATEALENAVAFIAREFSRSGRA